MPEFAKNQDLTLQDLRVIIHGLRMSGFAFVEPEALDQIKFRIKSLPTAEVLEGYGDDPQSLRRIAQEVGEIAHLLEVYGKKGEEFKARFESLKGLPPRYKVQEWRKNMPDNTNNTNNTVKFPSKNDTNELQLDKAATHMVREIIKISANADCNGNGEISCKLNAFAKNVLTQKATNKDVENIITILSKAGMDKDAKIVEAAWWNPKGFGKELGQGVKTMWQGKYKDQLVKEITAALDKFEQSMDTGVLFNETARLKKGWQNVNLNTDVKDRETIQKLLGHISSLEQGANEFNSKMLQEFSNWIAQQKQQLASVSGTSVGAPAAPGEAHAVPGEAPAASVDPKSMDNTTIDAILEALGVTSSQKKSIRTVKLGAALSPEILAYIEKLKKDPAALQKFIEQIKSRKAELAKGSAAGAAPAGAAPAAPAPAAPVAPPSLSPQELWRREQNKGISSKSHIRMIRIV